MQESDDGMESDYARVFKRPVPDPGLSCAFSNLALLFFINCVVIYIRLPNLLNVKRNDELKSTILPLKANLLNVSLRNAITVLECVVCYKSKLEIFGPKLKIAMVPSHVVQRG